MFSEIVLIIGSGAREHALALALSGFNRKIIIAPGNAGTSQLGRNVDVKPHDIAGLVNLAIEEKVDLVIVGPELPLALGLVNRLREQHIPVFGPTRNAAKLEFSKCFMKQQLAKWNIPTASFQIFNDPNQADHFIHQANRPLVIKADGLAFGKGVVVAQTTKQAHTAVDQIMRQKVFGNAGNSIVIEEVLTGQEVSFHVVSDGAKYVVLAPSQDYKTLYNDNLGPNTGGMGCYAPVSFVSEALERRILETIIEPTLKGMRVDDKPFQGVLFAGLMIKDEIPSVLEFNVRFGDPEITTLLPLLKGDWFQLLNQSAHGILDVSCFGRNEGSALSIVLAAKGYPAAPQLHDVIQGLDYTCQSGVNIYHAGTSQNHNGEILTAGGRVLTITAYDTNISLARLKAYKTTKYITWEGKHYRSDIGSNQ